MSISFRVVVPHYSLVMLLDIDVTVHTLNLDDCTRRSHVDLSQALCTLQNNLIFKLLGII